MHICIYLNYYYSVYLKCLGAVNAYLFSAPTHYMQWHSKRVAGMPPPPEGAPEQEGGPRVPPRPETDQGFCRKETNFFSRLFFMIIDPSKKKKEGHRFLFRTQIPNRLNPPFFLSKRDATFKTIL